MQLKFSGLFLHSFILTNYLVRVVVSVPGNAGYKAGMLIFCIFGWPDV